MNSPSGNGNSSAISFLPRRPPDASGGTHGRCSTPSSGSCAAVLPGGTFRSVTGHGKAPTTGTAPGPSTAHLRPHLGAAAGPAECGGAVRPRHLVCGLHDRQGLPSRSGSEKGGCEALGRSRGGFSTKVHLVCGGLGNPLAALLTPGQQHEGTVCQELLASVRVRTSTGGGRPRTRPKLVVADRGYDAGAFRRYLRRRGIRCVIPEKRVPAGKRRRRRGRPPTFCGGDLPTAQRGRASGGVAQGAPADRHTL